MGRPRFRQRVLGKNGLLQTFTIFGTVFGLVLGVILAMPLSATAGIAIGEPSPVAVRAPRELSFQSEVQTRQARERAANNPNLIVTQRDTQLRIRQRDEMQQAFDQIDAARGNTTLPAARREAAIVAASPVISETLASQITELDNERWQAVAEQSLALYDRAWEGQADGLNETELAEIRSNLLPTMVGETDLNATEQQIALQLANLFLVPNVTVDQEATERRVQAAMEAVQPVYVTVAEGESIVREGEIVTPEVHEKLQRFNLVFGAGGITTVAQQLLLGLLIGWMLASYLLFYQPELAQNWRALAIIAGVLLTVVLAGRLLVPAWEPTPFGFPLAVAGIVLALLFDRRLGLFGIVILAPLIGMQADRSIGLTLTLALGGAAGVFATHRATRSVMFIWTSIAVSVVTALAAIVFWLDRVGTATWMQAFSVPLLSLLNGTLASALAVGTYQLLGRVAHVSTPLQLMELAHPTQPLLHRLMREAPGTYHHSIVVANLAEVAAEDIGADPLLARVGAYYHDIGKVIRPYFFTDNQYERSNVHDELDAKTSATLIIDHVRDGEKLARQHGLPPKIIDFIMQHHGTTVVSYFYQRALHEDGEVDIKDFRYPGPKPQFRETGIMMLADGVEAAVRANAQSGKLRPARPEAQDSRDRNGLTIREVVDQIINDRVRTGQLDECPLTLRDISIIKDSFTMTLQGIYHPRVEYPPAQREVTTEPV